MTSATPRPPPENESAAASAEAHGAVFQSEADIHHSDQGRAPQDGYAAELNALPDPLRPAFEAVSAATDPRGKLEAIKRAAADLAIPIRHGLIDRYEIEERLIDLADTHGLIANLTRGAVEAVIVNALKTPALSNEPIEHAAGATNGGEPPAADDAEAAPMGRHVELG